MCVCGGGGGWGYCFSNKEPLLIMGFVLHRNLSSIMNIANLQYNYSMGNSDNKCTANKHACLHENDSKFCGIRVMELVSFPDYIRI